MIKFCCPLQIKSCKNSALSFNRKQWLLCSVWSLWKKKKKKIGFARLWSTPELWRIVPGYDSTVKHKGERFFFTTKTFSVTLQNPLTKDAHSTKFLFEVPFLLRTRLNRKNFNSIKSYPSRQPPATREVSWKPSSPSFKIRKILKDFANV